MPSAARADLPNLKEQPWLGYFLGMEEKRKFRFGISAKANGVVDPLKNNGEPVFANSPIQVNFDVVETLPDGKRVVKQVQSDSLASDQEASLNPRGPVTFRGKVTGDAAFEVTVTPERSGFALSGKLTDKGTLTNPLHFELSVDVRPYPRKPGDEPAKIKSFEERAEKDELSYETPKRERGKIEFLDEVNPAEKTADGMSRVSFESDGLAGHEFQLQSSDKAKLVFADAGVKPLWNGFTVRMVVAEGVDSSTQKLMFSVR